MVRTTEANLTRVPRRRNPLRKDLGALEEVVAACHPRLALRHKVREQATLPLGAQRRSEVEE